MQRGIAQKKARLKVGLILLLPHHPRKKRSDLLPRSPAFRQQVQRSLEHVEHARIYRERAVHAMGYGVVIDHLTVAEQHLQVPRLQQHGREARVIAKAGREVGRAAAVGAASAGVAALGTACINAYADYEQLVGGVETLFKDSADTIQTYADNAYKTAGLSANEYMETVTSFSASLLQSLDGDTEKAAAAADLAITDMADNANKMGTAMESIQNAYQGFAKQNYTMLDNLKLGYGGTKEEMQRLLADAEKLSGVKYDLSSYADIVEAIHAINITQVCIQIEGQISKYGMPHMQMA